MAVVATSCVAGCEYSTMHKTLNCALLSYYTDCCIASTIRTHGGSFDNIINHRHTLDIDGPRALLSCATSSRRIFLTLPVRHIHTHLSMAPIHIRERIPARVHAAAPEAAGSEVGECQKIPSNILLFSSDLNHDPQRFAASSRKVLGSFSKTSIGNCHSVVGPPDPPTSGVVQHRPLHVRDPQFPLIPRLRQQPNDCRLASAHSVDEASVSGDGESALAVRWRRASHVLSGGLRWSKNRCLAPPTSLRLRVSSGTFPGSSWGRPSARIVLSGHRNQRGSSRWGAVRLRVVATCLPIQQSPLACAQHHDSKCVVWYFFFKKRFAFEWPRVRSYLTKPGPDTRSSSACFPRWIGFRDETKQSGTRLTKLPSRALGALTEHVRAEVFVL